MRLLTNLRPTKSGRQAFAALCAKMQPAPRTGAGQGVTSLKVMFQLLALSTVTARRFCDQHEMSLHTATGRSLP
jgi:hypothetical protein